MCCGHHPEPPYHAEDTLSALRPSVTESFDLGLGGLGKQGSGRVGTTEKGDGCFLRVERALLGELYVCDQDGEVSLPHRQVWQVRVMMLMASVTSCPHLRSKGCLMSKCFAELRPDRQRHNLGGEAPPSSPQPHSPQLSNRFRDMRTGFLWQQVRRQPMDRGQRSGIWGSSGEQDQCPHLVGNQVRGRRNARGSSQGQASNSWSQVRSGG